MSMNPYEIRHEILKEAREMLLRIWDQDGTDKRYNSEITNNKEPIEFLPAPTFDEILALANKMNAFVSDSK